MNLAAGFVYSTKEKNGSNICLVPDARDAIPLQSTCYPQGRGKASLYGSPYSVCLGFPLNSTKLTTKLKIDQQKLFLKKVSEGIEIKHKDVFGSSEYLITMLNGGIRAAKLAYSRAHLKVMEMQNKNSQVLN